MILSKYILLQCNTMVDNLNVNILQLDRVGGKLMQNWWDWMLYLYHNIDPNWLLAQI